MLYLHGGAFALCRPQTMHDIIIRYALEIDAYVLCIDYRRPPKHTHPVALNDCVFAYQWLLRQVGRQATSSVFKMRRFQF